MKCCVNRVLIRRKNNSSEKKRPCQHWHRRQCKCCKHLCMSWALINTCWTAVLAGGRWHSQSHDGKRREVPSNQGASWINTEHTQTRKSRARVWEGRWCGHRSVIQALNPYPRGRFLLPERAGSAAAPPGILSRLTGSRQPSPARQTGQWIGCYHEGKKSGGSGRNPACYATIVSAIKQFNLAGVWCEAVQLLHMLYKNTVISLFIINKRKE